MFNLSWLLEWSTALIFSSSWYLRHTMYSYFIPIWMFLCWNRGIVTLTKPHKTLLWSLYTQGMVMEKEERDMDGILQWWTVDESFCPIWSHSHSIPNKHTEAYINHKLFSLLLRLITTYLLQWILCLSSSKNSLSLVTLYVLPAWLLAKQHFITPIQVTNLLVYKSIIPQHFPIFLFKTRILNLISFV